MQINFKSLIEQSGERLSQRQLAKEMTDKGLFKNLPSAYSMIQYHNTGKAKSCNFKLLLFLMERFNRKASDILNW